jgi:hypothetical protein
LSNKADILVSLDNLKRNLPNIEWVSVVVNWFADSLDPAVCLIKPAVEFDNTGAKVTPDEWAVGSFTRSTAHQLLHFSDGSITFGGTPTDKSIIRLCQELKSRGYKVLFYPMLQVDTITPQSKPWRGRIIPTISSEATGFFTRTHGYTAFINHYAGLTVGGIALKDVIDGFMIGSELVGLTTYMSSAGVFPAVSQLKSLAASVKSVVGSGVKVSYGGDWSEYHNVNGWYHMDPLWTDANIDMVCIDCYVPLTPDLPQSQIDYQGIYDGWTKDEGWDYYWNGDRTVKNFYSGATYAWKNIKHWWNSPHTNPNGSGTAWTAKMKPVWFSEMGFPSVDGCSNQPNVFVDPHSMENGYPRASRGRIDFMAQRVALEASLDYLKAENTLDPHFVPRRFVWTWDARPYPFYPDLLSVWADGTNWQTGHWIQGKVGLSLLGLIVSHLLQKVGYLPEHYDVSDLTDRVSGFIMSNRQTVRSSLEQLAMAYFFDMVESDGVLKFVKRGKPSSFTLDETELVSQDNTSDTLTITRLQELDLPRQIDVIYLNALADYQTGTQSSQRQTVKAVDITTLNLPLAFNDQEAKRIADMTLYSLWVNRVQFQFTLPPKMAFLEPTDVITLTKDGATFVLRINSTKLMRHGLQDVTGVAEEVSAYEVYIPPSSGQATPPALPSLTHLQLLDLPAFITDTMTEAPLRYGVVGVGKNWKGCVLYGSDDGGSTYGVIQSLKTQSVIGSALNSLPAGTPYTWDKVNTVDVLLIFGELHSITELAVLNGANACLIGDEILQFQTATLLGTHKYRLSTLLRGRLGTEDAVESHSAGERFILLDRTLGREVIASSGWGMNKSYKPVSVGSSLGSTAPQDFVYTARALKPYSPVHLSGSRNGGGDLTLTWKRRTRLGGDWRDGVDVPLCEESERYDIDILQGLTVKRTFEGIASSTVTYTASQQISDFGSVQSSISVAVYQISALVGRGKGGKAIL